MYKMSFALVTSNMFVTYDGEFYRLTSDITQAAIFNEYSDPSVFNSELGAVGIYHTAIDKYLRHYGYIVYGNDFSAQNYDFAWVFNPDGTIYNFFDGGWYLNITPNQDPVLSIQSYPLTWSRYYIQPGGNAPIISEGSNVVETAHTYTFTGTMSFFNGNSLTLPQINYGTIYTRFKGTSGYVFDIPNLSLTSNGTISNVSANLNSNFVHEVYVSGTTAFIDGEQYTIQAPSILSSQVTLGAAQSLTQFFVGEIYEFRLYDYVEDYYTVKNLKEDAIWGPFDANTFTSYTFKATDYYIAHPFPSDISNVIVFSNGFTLYANLTQDELRITSNNFIEYNAGCEFRITKNDLSIYVDGYPNFTRIFNQPKNDIYLYINADGYTIGGDVSGELTVPLRSSVSFSNSAARLYNRLIPEYEMFNREYINANKYINLYVDRKIKLNSNVVTYETTGDALYEFVGSNDGVLYENISQSTLGYLNYRFVLNRLTARITGGYFFSYMNPDGTIRTLEKVKVGSFTDITSNSWILLQGFYVGENPSVQIKNGTVQFSHDAQTYKLYIQTNSQFQNNDLTYNFQPKVYEDRDVSDFKITYITYNPKQLYNSFRTYSVNSYTKYTTGAYYISTSNGLIVDDGPFNNKIFGDGIGVASMFDSATTNVNITYEGFMSGSRIMNLQSTDHVSVVANYKTILNNADKSLFDHVQNLAIDDRDNIYVADTGNALIRKITPSGQTTTVAGIHMQYGNQDGGASLATFDAPYGVAYDSLRKKLYVADAYAFTLRVIGSDGFVDTLAGAPYQQDIVDGVGSNARFQGPVALSLDDEGNIFVSESPGSVIRKVTPEGVVTTIAGVPNVDGYEDGPAETAKFNFPGSTLLLGNTLYIADTRNNCIRTLNVISNVVSTFIGVPQSSFPYDGDVTTARFLFPTGLAHLNGNIYVTDILGSTVRRVTLDGTATTIAGHPNEFSNIDGPGLVATFNAPVGIVADSKGNLYIGDDQNNCIRKIDAEYNVTTLAGSLGPEKGYVNSCTEVELEYPDDFVYPFQITWTSNSQIPLTLSYTHVSNLGPYYKASSNIGFTYTLNGNEYTSYQTAERPFNKPGFGLSKLVQFSNLRINGSSNGIVTINTNYSNTILYQGSNEYVAWIQNATDYTWSALYADLTNVVSINYTSQNVLPSNVQNTEIIPYTIELPGYYVTDLNRVSNSKINFTFGNTNVTMTYSESSNITPTVNVFTPSVIYNDAHYTYTDDGGFYSSYVDYSFANVITINSSNVNGTPTTPYIKSNVLPWVSNVVTMRESFTYLTNCYNTFMYTDASDNVYLYGIRGEGPATVYVGSYKILEEFEYAAVLVKLDKSGNVLWRVYAPYSYEAHDVRVLSGNVYFIVTGGTGIINSDDTPGPTTSRIMPKILYILNSSGICQAAQGYELYGSVCSLRLTGSNTYIIANSQIIQTDSSGKYTWKRYITNVTDASLDYEGSNVYVAGTKSTGETHIYNGESRWNIDVAVFDNFTGTGSSLYSSTVNSNNEIIVSGSYTGSTSISSLSLPSLVHSTSRAAYFVKLSSYGDPLHACAVTFDEPNHNVSEPAVSIDSGSNVFMAFNYYSPGVSGTVYNSNSSTFPVQIPESGYSNKCVLIKYNSNGFAQWWTRAYGSYQNDFVKWCSIDTTGNPVMCGYYNNPDFKAYNSDGTQSSLTFPNNNYNNTGFMIKYNTNGFAQWGSAIQIDEGGWTSVEGATADSGNVYTTGWIYGTNPKLYHTDGSFTSLPSPTGSGAFTVKLSNTGVYQWFIGVDGASADSSFSVTTKNSNVYISGQYGPNQATFTGAATGYLPSVTNQSGFVAKISSSGSRIWSAYIDGGSVWSVTVDGAQNVYVAGLYNTSAIIYDSTGTPSAVALPTLSGASAFAVKYNSSGIAQWCCAISTAEAFSIIADASDRVVLSGNYGPGTSSIYISYPAVNVLPGLPYTSSRTGFVLKIDPIDANIQTIPVTSGSSAFVTKFASNGSYMWDIYMDGAGDDYGNSIKTDVGCVYITGTKSNDTLSSIKNGLTVSSIPETFGQGAYIMKISSDGVPLWNGVVDGIDDDSGLDVNVDNKNNVYMAGLTGPNGAFIYGTQNSTCIGGFYVKYSPTGQVTDYGYCDTMSSPRSITLDSINNPRVLFNGMTNASNIYTPSKSPVEIPYILGSAITVYFPKNNIVTDTKWIAYANGTSNVVVTSIATDDDRNAYIAGYTGSGNVIVYNSNGTPSSNLGTGNCSFVIKYDSYGSVKWRAFVTNPLTVSFPNIAVDSNKNVYLISSNSLRGNIYDSSNYTGYYFSNNCACILKLNSNGIFQAYTAWTNGEGYGIDVDGNGNIYACGVAGTSNILNSNLSFPPSNTSTRGVLVKFDSNCIAQWRSYSTTRSVFKSVRTDSDTNVYVSGWVDPGANVVSTSNISLPVTSNVSPVCVKFTSNGTPLFRIYMNDTSPSTSLAYAGFCQMRVDTDKNIYVTGTKSNLAANIYNASSTSPLWFQSNVGPFCIKFNPSGDAQWIVHNPTMQIIPNRLYAMTYPFTFTNMNASGAYGPSSITYGTSTPGYGTSNIMTLSAGIQYWTVPITGRYQIIAAGAKGGNSDFQTAGGRGVIVSSNVTLVAGTVLKILVGQMGVQVNTYQGGGGGGTFITYSNNYPICIAGGGGGLWNTGQTGQLSTGQLSTVGATGYAGGTSPTTMGGGGGILDTRNLSTGGAGFYSNIAPDGRANDCFAFINGGVGSVASGGGFGCGSSGGGGYSGGGGLNYGGQGRTGGGGSFDINGVSNAATLYTDITTGYNTGNGFAIVNLLDVQVAIASDVAVDKSKNVYLSGVANTGRMGVLTLPDQSTTYGYVIKTDSNGVAQWSTSVDSASVTSSYTAITTDSLNNVYLAGIRSNSLVKTRITNANETSSLTIPPMSNQGVYVVKFDATGTADSNLLNITNNFGMAADTNNVYSCCTLNEPYAQIFNLTSAGRYQAVDYGSFVYKTDFSSKPLSGIKLGSYINGVATENSNVYIVGRKLPTTSPETGSYAAFVSKFPDWVVYSSLGANEAVDVKYANGNIFVIGNAKNYSNIGNVNIPYQASYLIKMSTSGNVLWRNHISNCYARGIETEPTGNIYVIGNGSNMAISNVNGSIAHTLSTSNASICVKYNSSGNYLWRTYTTNSFTTSITKDLFGNVYVTGNYYANSFFYNAGGTVFSNLTSPGAFISRIGLLGNLGWVNKIAGNIVGISITSNLYVAGSYTGAANILYNNLNTAHTLSSSNSGFIVQYTGNPGVPINKFETLVAPKNIINNNVETYTTDGLFIRRYTSNNSAYTATFWKPNDTPSTDYRVVLPPSTNVTNVQLVTDVPITKKMYETYNTYQSGDLTYANNFANFIYYDTQVDELELFGQCGNIAGASVTRTSNITILSNLQNAIYFTSTSNISRINSVLNISNGYLSNTSYTGNVNLFFDGPYNYFYNVELISNTFSVSGQRLDSGNVTISCNKYALLYPYIKVENSTKIISNPQGSYQLTIKSNDWANTHFSMTPIGSVIGTVPGNVLNFTKTSHGTIPTLKVLYGNSLVFSNSLQIYGYTTTPFVEIEPVGKFYDGSDIIPYSLILTKDSPQSSNLDFVSFTDAGVSVNDYDVDGSINSMAMPPMSYANIHGYFSLPTTGSYTTNLMYNNIVTGNTAIDSSNVSFYSNTVILADTAYPFSISYFNNINSNTFIDVQFTLVTDSNVSYMLSDYTFNNDHRTVIPNLYRTNTAIANYNTIVG